MRIHEGKKTFASCSVDLHISLKHYRLLRSIALGGCPRVALVIHFLPITILHVLSMQILHPTHQQILIDLHTRKLCSSHVQQNPPPSHQQTSLPQLSSPYLFQPIPEPSLLHSPHGLVPSHLISSFLLFLSLAACDYLPSLPTPW